MLAPERLGHDLKFVLVDDVPRPVGCEHYRPNVVHVENGGKLSGHRDVAHRGTSKPAQRRVMPVRPTRTGKARRYRQLCMKPIEDLDEAHFVPDRKPAATREQSRRPEESGWDTGIPVPTPNDKTNEHCREFPAVPVKVVDTTGAGDAFTAALAVALAEGKDITTALRFASCSGAFACTRLGVIPSLGHRTQIDKLFDQHFTNYHSK